MTTNFTYKISVTVMHHLHHYGFLSATGISTNIETETNLTPISKVPTFMVKSLPIVQIPPSLEVLRDSGMLTPSVANGPKNGPYNGLTRKNTDSVSSLKPVSLLNHYLILLILKINQKA